MTSWCWHCNHLREAQSTKRRGWICLTCNESMVQHPTGITTVYGGRGPGTTKPAFSPKMS